MKKNLSFTFIVFLLSLIACTKNSSNTDKVFIRVENATTENFHSFTLQASEFGGIASGDTSKYRIFNNILPFPFANLITINNQTPYIVDIVPTPYMKNGSYLMKVIDDTLPYRYRASFINE